MLETSEATQKLVKDLIEVLREANQEVSPELKDLLRTASEERFNRRGHQNRNNSGFNNNRRMDNYDRFGSRNRNDFDGDYGSRGYNRSFNNRSRHSNYNNKQSFDSIYDELDDWGTPNKRDRGQEYEKPRRPSNVSITSTNLYDSVLQNLKPKD